MAYNDEPYVAIQSRTFGLTIDDVRGCFEPGLGLDVKYPEEIPVGHLAGLEVQEAKDLASWIINVGPDLLWQMCIWALATWFGKESVSGFAKEFGKDAYQGAKGTGIALWSGIKALVRKIADARKAGKKPSEYPYTFLKIVAEKEGCVPGESVLISLHVWDDDTSLQHATGMIERVALPLVAKYMASELPPRLNVLQGMTVDGAPLTEWTIWDRANGAIVELPPAVTPPSKPTFRVLKTTPPANDNLVKFLKELGLEEEFDYPSVEPSLLPAGDRVEDGPKRVV